MNAGELIQYTTVEEMAAVYREATAKIREAMLTIGQQTDRLRQAFAEEYSYAFGIDLHHQSNNFDATDEGAERLLAKVKLQCWGRIIDKLNIRRLMSSQRERELGEALQGRGDTVWPDITPENIERVANGYLMSATEFLEEAVAEEYDFWRPRTGHRTNDEFWKLTRKVIEPYMVELWGWGDARFRCNYHRQQHITALDNIMHMLDGKGPVTEYKGALATAIESSPTGTGQTEYFRFKCFKNGNLHLEFKRQDLLDVFNTIASKRDRLGQVRR